VRAWFFGLMTLVPLGVLGVSCALSSFEKVEPPPDAGPQECRPASVPLPPNLLDADNGDAVSSGDVEFTVAVKTLRMKKTFDAGPLGLDLDRYCSCQGDTPSCIAPDKQDPALRCDLPDGRDNQLIALVRIIEVALLLDTEGDELSALYSEFATLGRWSILMRVSEYNGLPNDDKVRVEWYPSGGFKAPVDGGLDDAGLDDAGLDDAAPEGLPPFWQGKDPWPIVPSAFEDAGADAAPVAKFADNEAYVTNGKLVFSLISSEFTATNGFTRLSMTISEGSGMAQIEQGPYGYYLRDGIIGGRLELRNIFKMVADFRDHNGAPFCANVKNPLWGATLQAFCRSPDIQVGSAQVNKKCDAISVGLGFEAEPAVVGPIEPGLTGQENCEVGEDPLSYYDEAGCPPN
jgi:hypothetical protein